MAKKGFTLIEALVATAITGILVVVLVLFYLKSVSIFNTENSESQLQNYTRQTLDSINTWAKKSISVITTYTTPGNITYSSSSSVLILKMSSVDINQNIIANTYDYLVIKRNNADESKIEELLFANALSKRVSSTKTLNAKTYSMTFKYYNASGNEITSAYENTVKISSSIVSKEILNDKTNTVSYKTETKLRNK